MIIISKPEFCEGESETLNALFAAGMPCLHLRKPNATNLQMHTLLTSIDVMYHNRIMLHSHYHLTEVFNLKGIHFTEKTKSEMQNWQHVAAVKSMAVHVLDALNAVPECIDYVLLSPIFPSVSKQNYSKQWDAVALKNALNNDRNFRLVALGGVTVNNFEIVLGMGFDDFALLGSIWCTNKDLPNGAIDNFKSFCQ